MSKIVEYLGIWRFAQNPNYYVSIEKETEFYYMRKYF